MLCLDVLSTVSCYSKNYRSKEMKDNNRYYINVYGSSKFLVAEWHCNPNVVKY